MRRTTFIIDHHPESEDDIHIKKRSMNLVQRTLVNKLPYLEELRKKVVWHITHEKSKEMNMKSRTNSYGVVMKNHASTEG